jgi:peptidoglycan/xylan/chitin deacetylase (PgdA/CDA1 family)
MRPAVRAVANTIRPVATSARALPGPEPLTVVGWHRIDDLDGGLSTSRDVFIRQLDELDRWGASVLPLAEADRLRQSGGLPDRAVALTFDDGYTSVVDTAWPILRERGLPATMYVVSGFLDGASTFPWDAALAGDPRVRLADRKAVREVAADGMDIGSHTVTHRWLPHLPPGELERELIDSRRELEDLLGAAVSSTAYPMGGWNRRVRAAAQRAGYHSAVTVDRGASTRRRHRLALRRTFAPATVADFRLVLDGAYTWLRPVDRWRTRSGPR